MAYVAVEAFSKMFIIAMTRKHKQVEENQTTTRGLKNSAEELSPILTVDTGKSDTPGTKQNKMMVMLMGENKWEDPRKRED